MLRNNLKKRKQYVILNKNRRDTNACDLSLRIKSGSVRLYGEYEGPYNGIEPLIYTNIFSTTKEYYLHIVDAFGQEDHSAELYVDLTKVTVD